MTVVKYSVGIELESSSRIYWATFIGFGEVTAFLENLNWMCNLVGITYQVTIAKIIGEDLDDA